MARSELDSLVLHVRDRLASLGVKRSHSVLVGVSGGVDSMVLLHVFHTLLRSRVFQKLAVAHLDHMLRGRESDADRQLVVLSAAKLDLDCYLTIKDVGAAAARSGIGVEEAGRNARYEFFQEIAETEGFAWVATAHHGGDRIETLLMNIARGTGLRGLASIPERRVLGEESTIIRPLLDRSRDEIVRYARAHRIRWREDKSNRSEEYARNRIRARVIPALQAAMPSRDIESAVARLSETTRDVLELLDRLASELRTKAIRSSSDQWFVRDRASALDLTVLRDAPPTIVRELLVAEFASALGSSFTPSTAAWSKIREMITQKRDASLQLSRELRVSLKKNILLVEPSYPAGHLRELLPVGGAVETEIGRLELARTKRRPGIVGTDECLLPAALESEHGLVVRTWRPSDRIKPFGMRGSRLVSDLLSEAGVKTIRSKRRFPVVVLADQPSEVVWVPGVRAAERCRVSDASETALLLRRKLS